MFHLRRAGAVSRAAHVARRWNSDKPTPSTDAAAATTAATASPTTTPAAADAEAKPAAATPPASATPSDASADASARAEAKAASSGGLVSSVLASLMKTDVRAAYECSLLPADKQKEFLAHVRDMDSNERKHELEKLKATGVTDLDVAKLKAEAAIKEIKERRATEEEAEQANHLRNLELLEKKLGGEVALARSKYKARMWSAAAERERRLRMRAEELAKREEHKLTLERLQREHDMRKQETEEALRVEGVRHAQTLEVEAAKASAAKERLAENMAAVKMGPNSVLGELREEERLRDEKLQAEREQQRQHEWDMHVARLKEAEERAREAAKLGETTLRSEVMWRLAQIVLAAFAVFGAYDWEMKKIGERQAARDAEAAEKAAEREAEAQKRRDQLEAEKAKRADELLAMKERQNLQDAAGEKAENWKQALIALELKKVSATKEVALAREAEAKAEAEKNREELKVAEAAQERERNRVQQMQSTRSYLSAAGLTGLFFSMMFLGHQNR